MKRKYEKPIIGLVEFEVNGVIASCDKNFFTHSRRACDPIVPNTFGNLTECEDLPPEDYCYNSNLENPYFSS